MKKILVVIDMQNDFIDGALGTPEAVAIVENVKAKILSYPKENVFATRDTHHQYYMDTQEGRNLPVPHCIRGTDGWQIRPEIAELIFPDHIVDKPTFGSTQLAKLMEVLERREEDGIEIELVGPAAQGFNAGDADLLRRILLRRRDARQARSCPGDHALLPDQDHQRLIRNTDKAATEGFCHHSGVDRRVTLRSCTVK